MKLSRICGATLVAVIILGVFSLRIMAAEKIEPDPKAVELIDKMLQAFANPDEAARLQAILPLMHPSILTEDGKDLNKNFKVYQYKKANMDAKLYKQPPEVFEVMKGKPTEVGFEKTKESGRKDKYYLTKTVSKGKKGYVVIFFPDKGDPKIFDFGAL